MTIELTRDKKIKIRYLCAYILSQEKPTIRLIAKLLGKFTSSIHAIKYSLLHYRASERPKKDA